MEEKDIRKILEIIINKISKKNIILGVEGSANLLIPGIKLQVQDLDITTDINGIDTFENFYSILL